MMSFAQLTVRRPPRHAGGARSRLERRVSARAAARLAREEAAARHGVVAAPEVAAGTDEVEVLGVELALVWADFERMLRQVPLVRRLEDGRGHHRRLPRLLVNLRPAGDGGRALDRPGGVRRLHRAVPGALDVHRPRRRGAQGLPDARARLRRRSAARSRRSCAQPKNIGSEALRRSCSTRRPSPTRSTWSARCSSSRASARRRPRGGRSCCSEHLRSRRPSRRAFSPTTARNDDKHFDKLEEVVAQRHARRAMARARGEDRQDRGAASTRCSSKRSTMSSAELDERAAQRGAADRHREPTGHRIPDDHADAVSIASSPHAGGPRPRAGGRIARCLPLGARPARCRS